MLRARLARVGANWRRVVTFWLCVPASEERHAYGACTSSSNASKRPPTRRRAWRRSARYYQLIRRGEFRAPAPRDLCARRSSRGMTCMAEEAVFEGLEAPGPELAPRRIR